MKPAAFAYARPTILGEALALLADHGGDARILAGGQSLMPMLNFRLAQPTLLVDINRIADGGRIEVDGEGMSIGPLVRHAELLRHCKSAGHPLLAAALPLVAHAGVRNRGTVCGSLALADPAAEMPACAVALGARLKLASTGGERWVAAEDFFTGIYETALAENEMIAAVRYPPAEVNWRWTCVEVARRHGDFAIAGLAAGLELRAGALSGARLVAFGVADRPLRLGTTETALVEDGVDAALASLDSVEIIGSPDYPQAYRRTVLGMLLRRAVSAMHAEVPT